MIEICGEEREEKSDPSAALRMTVTRPWFDFNIPNLSPFALLPQNLGARGLWTGACHAPQSKRFRRR